MFGGILMADIIDGKVIAGEIKTQLIEKVETTDNKKIGIPLKPDDIKVEVKTVKPEPVNIQKNESVETVEVAKKGSWQLQLMASSDINAINKGWSDLKNKHSKLKNISYEIENSKLDNNSPIFRLKVGEFSTKEEADMLCAQLKSEGLGCFAKQK